jgi:hypothetical protein
MPRKGQAHNGNARAAKAQRGCPRKGQANAPKPRREGTIADAREKSSNHRTPSPKSKKGGGLKKRPAARRAKRNQSQTSTGIP